MVPEAFLRVMADTGEKVSNDMTTRNGRRNVDLRCFILLVWTEVG